MRSGFWLSCIFLAIPAGGAMAKTPAAAAKTKEAPSRDIPLDSLDAKARETAKFILDKVSFSARGPVEVFEGKPAHYLWLLDNPHRAVVAWRRLGAKCVAITPKDKSTFSWSDDTGSEVVWEAVLKTTCMRIWLAEGKVKPGPLLPMVPVKALVVLRHHETKAADGGKALHHQADLFVNTDSKTAHMLMRMLGPSAARMGEDGLGQLQLFFSGLTWYFDRHPEEVKDLLREGD